jgi:hypothetical protein
MFFTPCYVLVLKILYLIKMKYEREYQIFAKEITDKFISMVTGELPTQCFCGEMSDGPSRIPTEEEQREFFKENNKYALEWLNKNMVTYDEWIAKHKTNS